MNTLASTKIAELKETIATYRQSGFEPSKKIILSGSRKERDGRIYGSGWMILSLLKKQLLVTRRQKLETEFREVMIFGTVLVGCGVLSFAASLCCFAVPL